ncbi:MAG: EAL domain-containing protein, partial [Lachnospiraceae bacterium]|nr:EAL domain-containing protein [Lachnospiraceae bacterium]
MKKIGKNKKRQCIMGSLLCLFAMLVVEIGNFGTLSVKADEKTIRVGYDMNASFIQQNDDGYYGYGVEYLEKIAEFTDWEYEYVKYNSWANSLESLKNGEIDLICTAHYMEEREEYFLYSNIPLGYEATILYTSKDKDIAYQDYETMNGCSVGFLTESYSAKEFIAFAEEKGIIYTPVYFQNENDMLKALKDGNVDMLAIGSRYANSEMKMVERLGANAFYCITQKDNVEFIKEIENTLQQLKFEYPELEGNLSTKYFGHTHMSDTALYTKEELEYIQNLEPIKVKIVKSSVPVSYEKNGEPAGIFAEYLNLISDKSGVNFEIDFIDVGMIEETQNALLTEPILMIRTERYLDTIEEKEIKNHISHTVSFFDTGMLYFRHKDITTNTRASDLVMALTKDKTYLEPLFKKWSEDYVLKYYSSTDACLEAVTNGEADLAVVEKHLANYIIHKPKYNRTLVEAEGKECNNAFCLVGNKDMQMLVDILDRAIHHITEDESAAVINNEVLKNPYKRTFYDIIYLYWGWILLAIVGIIALMASYVLIERHRVKIKIQEKEYEILERQIQLDELTGVYNRKYFFEQARELIDTIKEPMCIVNVDICNFKIINELYGMENGDKVLKEFAKQLINFVQNCNTAVARFMSDHFFLCISKRDFEELKFPKVYETFLEGMDIKVVYGVFLIEDQTDLPVNIMCDRASIAAHDKNRKDVKYIRYYNDAERKQMLLEQEIENDMEKAVREREFCIYVQPKYDVCTEEIVGGEALVRWMHPKKGMISPGIFIPVFEKNGFIIQADYYIWEETCRILSELKKKEITGYPISINVSRAHFYGNELKDKLMELIQKYGLEPSDLELEITETICVDDPEIIYAKMRELQSLGFFIAMDDFGSGYSSLNMLKEMPLDIIKMDLKFLDGGD